MTIYVDDLYDWGIQRGGEWCHMMTDDPTLLELFEMAQKLDIQQHYQRHPYHPHYDLSPNKRREAIAKGAVSISSQEMVKRCSMPKAVGVDIGHTVTAE